MKVGIIGINYKNSNLHIRETIARVSEELFYDQKLSHDLSPIILNTCNRTEIYYSSDDLLESQKKLYLFFRRYMDEALSQYFYSFFEEDCFYHLGRVVTGLDSAIYGETEIQRQVKLSYEKVRKQKKLPFALHFLFQKSLKIGKEVRTSFLGPKQTFSLPSLVIQQMHKRYPSKASVLLIGYSEMNQTIAMQLKQLGWTSLTFCTRAAQGVCHSFHYLPWDQLQSQYQFFDIIICATYHHEYLIKANKQSSQQLFIDLSVPRCIDPELAKEKNIELLNLDQISRMIPAVALVQIEKRQQCMQYVSFLVQRQIALYHKKILKNQGKIVPIYSING